MGLLLPYESACTRHGVPITIRAQPTLAPYDPTSDTDREPVDTTPVASTAVIQNEAVTGLADVYDLTISITFTRQVVDGVQLGVPAGFNMDQATVNIGGIDFRVININPAYFQAVQQGWDLKIGR